ncbi:mechanosensitive ion channel [Verrucomicrobiaceae bacterium N1E253]|uniref:Mechanosensitive ion channel n=1 Tax=Oceaniferula marina TaxID=2748318 RepID=A0A851GR33_9BACT|nr:mechanosensitive ion channel domain-containing protein [Oceaniferula marina]NWK57447.1 mechanosensitive ion channel [Oceaniferula marina]
MSLTLLADLAADAVHAWENVWLQTAVAVVLTYIAHLVIRGVLLRPLERIADATSNDLDDRLVHFLRIFYKVALVFGLFLVVLKIHGIAITPLLASAGIAGIAIGLAAKETLADILAGIFLITDRPIKIGDRVKIERIGKHWGAWGDVLDIGLRRTCIRNTDGVAVNYPNNILANSIITNFSHDDGPMRVRVRFQVDHDADIEHVCDVAKLAIQRTEHVIDESSEVVVRSLWHDDGGHMHSGILVEGRYRIPNIRERTRIRSAVLKNILADFKTNRIQLSSPTIKVGA